MPDQLSRNTHRSIQERVIVRGTLVLESPAHFGGAEPDALTDMPVLLDEVNHQPLLPGTSIAGALRNYLREFQAGDGKAFPKGDRESDDYKAAATDERKWAATYLFGGFRGDDDGEQSPLIVEDSVGRLSEFELRDGVSIEPSTRTAKDDQKFDIQLLGAGTEFPLQFELVIREGAPRQELLKGLATALKGFEDGAIALGSRKRRGFGKCRVAGWEVVFYNLKTKQGLLDWLTSERSWGTVSSPEKKPIKDALGVTALLDDMRRRAALQATFSLAGTLLIRSGFGDLDARADTVHLEAVRAGDKRVPVIPGTSWAGVLRHRALKIARTLSSNDGNNGSTTAHALIDDLFGPSEIKQGTSFREERQPAKASRISIEESEIQKVKSLEITRVAIDRFTGGAYEGALFTEQPVIGMDDSEVNLNIIVRNASKADIGLLLFLLKDLWTGDLPIGGEAGIGRGRLSGRHARLSYEDQVWEIRESDGSLQVTPDPAGLEQFVAAFRASMDGAK